MKIKLHLWACLQISLLSEQKPLTKSLFTGLNYLSHKMNSNTESHVFQIKVFYSIVLLLENLF